MGKMYGLSEASAVHFRVEDDQSQCEYGKESLKNEGGKSCHFPPCTCNEGSSYDSFKQGECFGKMFCRTIQKADMKEVEIFLHYQPRSYRIHQFQYSSDEEYYACGKTAEPLHPLQDISHFYAFVAESTTSFTLAKIAPGGSISPYSSLQSILMNLGSSSHCFL